MPRNLIYFIPASWIILAPLTLLTTTIVLYISLKIFYIENTKEIFKKTFFKIFLTTFLSHIITSILIFTIGQLPYGVLIFTNQFDKISLIGILLLVFAISLGVIINYFLIKKVVFKWQIKEENLKKYISLIISILSAPYILLVV